MCFDDFRKYFNRVYVLRIEHEVIAYLLVLSSYLSTQFSQTKNLSLKESGKAFQPLVA